MVLPRTFLLPCVASGGGTLVLVVLLVESHKIQLLLTYFSFFPPIYLIHKNTCFLFTILI